jgi:hypothetical protein
MVWYGIDLRPGAMVGPTSRRAIDPRKRLGPAIRKVFIGHSGAPLTNVGEAKLGEIPKVHRQHARDRQKTRPRHVQKEGYSRFFLEV